MILVNGSDISLKEDTSALVSSDFITFSFTI